VSFFDQVKAAVGVGAATVTVEIERREYAWDDVIEGTARIHGGEVDQEAARLRVAVRQHWVEHNTRYGTTHKDDEYRYHADTVVAEDVPVPAGSYSEPLPFRIRVPSDLPVEQKYDYAVAARLAIVLGSESEGAASIEVRLEDSIQGLILAVKRLGRLDVEWSHHGVALPHKATGRIDIDCRPTKALKESLDGLKLTVEAKDGRLAGTLEINPRDRTPVEHLKALVRADRIRHPLDFEAKPLAEFARQQRSKAKGAVPPEEVMRRLRELLKPYLNQTC
jgi:sporulation-control protein spo0M